MKNYLLIPVLLFAFTCQAQNTAASPDKKASKEDPQLIGKWKIKDFNMVKAPKGVSAEWKADFSKKTKEVGTLQFGADHSYKATMAEGEESGTWQAADDGKSVIVTQTDAEGKREMDTVRISKLSGDVLQGSIRSSVGSHVDIGLTRVK